MITDDGQVRLTSEGAPGTDSGVANEDTYPHKELTHRIIGAAYEVHSVLGGGFLEKVYENALAVELEARGLRVRTQVPIPVHYKKRAVGEYFADLIVEDVVLCEIKAGAAISGTHEAQLLHYLKATNTKLGLLLNFGPSRVHVRRLVF